MINLIRVLEQAARSLNWEEGELSALRSELEDFETLDLLGLNSVLSDIGLQISDLTSKWRTDMDIKQEQIDTLAQEIADVNTGLDTAKTRSQGLQDNLTAVATEVDSLKQQLADAAKPFDSTALDTALKSAAAKADGIAQATNVPAPTLPVLVGT